jgi:hypothetical protein
MWTAAEAGSCRWGPVWAIDVFETRLIGDRLRLSLGGSGATTPQNRSSARAPMPRHVRQVLAIWTSTASRYTTHVGTMARPRIGGARPQPPVAITHTPFLHSFAAAHQFTRSSIQVRSAEHLGTPLTRRFFPQLALAQVSTVPTRVCDMRISGLREYTSSI